MHQGGIVQNAGRRVVGLLDDGRQLRRTTHGALAGDVEGRLAVLRSAGNLGRTPRIWVKPKTAHRARRALHTLRSDEFTGPRSQNVWQWNHVPDDTKWSLTERRGFLATALAARAGFLDGAQHAHAARRRSAVVAPRRCSSRAGCATDDVAGLALLNRPYAWIGVRRARQTRCFIERFDEVTGDTAAS